MGHSQPSNTDTAPSQWLPYNGEQVFYINQRRPYKNKNVPWTGLEKCEFWEEVEGAVSTSRAVGGNVDELWSNPVRKKMEKRKLNLDLKKNLSVLVQMILVPAIPSERNL